MKIAIAAAGGNVGSRIAQQLQNTPGIELILLGKNKTSLEKLKIHHAKIEITDISNIQEVTKATQNVDALFWMAPPAQDVSSLADWYRNVTDAGISAVKNNNIKRVLLLSSLGAGSKDHLGTVTYAGKMEEAFDKLSTNVLALRPGYFMENLLLQQTDLLNKGILSFTYAANHSIPFISTDDIGDAAAHYLRDETWSGKWKLNLMGPENITPLEMAYRLSAILHKKISYHKLSKHQAAQNLDNWKVSTVVKEELLELFAALGDPKGVYSTPRTFEAYTPTTLEDFIQRKFTSL